MTPTFDLRIFRDLCDAWRTTTVGMSNIHVQKK